MSSPSDPGYTRWYQSRKSTRGSGNPTACDDDRSRPKFQRSRGSPMRSSDALVLGFQSSEQRMWDFRDNKGDGCSYPTTISGMNTAAVTQDWRRSRQVCQPAQAGSLGSSDEVHWTALSYPSPRSANHSRTYGNFYLEDDFDSYYFDGDTQIDNYLSWEQEIEGLFDYFRISENKQVRFVVSKLIGRAKIWWNLIKRARRIEGRRDIQTWSRMKRLLRSQFLSPDFNDSLFCNSNNNLQQCDTSANAIANFRDESIVVATGRRFLEDESGTSVYEASIGDFPESDGLPECPALELGHSACENVDDDQNTVIVCPDYVNYRDPLLLESDLTFCSDCSKIECSDASKSGEKLILECGTIDVMWISYQWSRSVSALLFKLRIKVNAGHNVEKYVASIADEFWLDKEKKIKSLAERYKDIWNDLSDNYALEGDMLKTNISFSKRYFSEVMEPFEDVIHPKGDPDVVSINERDIEILEPNTFINYTIIDFYIKYLQNKVQLKEKRRFHFFNSLFFRELDDLDKDPGSISQERAAFQRVQKWTRKLKILEKDYMFILVNFNLHWSLLVIFHPGEISTFARVLTYLFEKEVEFQLIHTDTYKGKQIRLDYLKLQPSSESLAYEDGKKLAKEHSIPFDKGKGEQINNLPETITPRHGSAGVSDVVISGSIVEPKLSIYGKCDGNSGSSEVLILELLGGGRKVNIFRSRCNFTIKTKLHSQKNVDGFQGQLCTHPKYLAPSVVTEKTASKVNANWFNMLRTGMMLTVRDILSWIFFINITKGNLGSEHAFLHGAILVLLAGLSLGTCMLKSEALMLRKSSLHILIEELKASGLDLSSARFYESENFGWDDCLQRADISYPNNALRENVFGIDPFFIDKGPDNCKDDGFESNLNGDVTSVKLKDGRGINTKATSVTL